jgi:hypothetical protein
MAHRRSTVGDGADVPVLNLELYRRLDQEFGPVKISNHGQNAAINGVRMNVERGKPEPNVAYWGEYYRVSCPYCPDGNYRLWVCHLYGSEYEGTDDRFLHTAICYHRGCLQDRYFRENFEERLFALGPRRSPPLRVRPSDMPQIPLEPRMPGPVTLVDQMPPDSKAVQYLIRRRFDIQELARVFQIGVCIDADNVLFRPAIGRIIAPIIWRGEFCGWQGRYPGEANWKVTGIPKYFNMPGGGRNRYLYNADLALAGQTLVLVEGVTDVWAIGPDAAALLCKTLSVHQAKLIADWAARTPDAVAVILLDSEAKPEAERIATTLAGPLAGRVVVVDLPAGVDPGKLARPVVRGLIREAITQRFPEVPFD